MFQKQIKKMFVFWHDFIPLAVSAPFALTGTFSFNFDLSDQLICLYLCRFIIKVFPTIFIYSFFILRTKVVTVHNIYKFYYNIITLTSRILIFSSHIEILIVIKSKVVEIIMKQNILISSKTPIHAKREILKWCIIVLLSHLKLPED